MLAFISTPFSLSAKSKYYCNYKVNGLNLNNELMECLFEDALITPVKVSGQLGYEVAVVPTNKGSQRVIKVFDFEENYEHLKLGYQVEFAIDFDFANGGKLLGLAPENILSGGMVRGKEESEGWSVRTIFGKNGALGVYYYLPSDTQKYGNFFMLGNTSMEAGKSYEIELVVQINGKNREGYICLYLQDSKGVSSNKCKKNLSFTDKIESGGTISRLLFNFFHGGNSLKYRPENSSTITYSNIKILDVN